MCGRVRADFFDTADYVNRLENQGLNRKQAEGVVDALEDIIQEAISNLQGNLVTRTEHYKASGVPRLLEPEKTTLTSFSLAAS